MHEDFHKPQAFFDQVHDGIVLPLEICDHLLQTMVAEGLDIDDRVAKAFRYIFSSKDSSKNRQNSVKKSVKKIVKKFRQKIRQKICDHLLQTMVAEGLDIDLCYI